MALLVIISSALVEGAINSDDAWMFDSIEQVNENITSLAASCGLSFALDVLQPCPQECSRFCGVDQRDSDMWSRQIATGAQLMTMQTSAGDSNCADYDSACLRSNPLCVSPTGAHSVFEDSVELSLETGYTLLSDANLNAPWLPYGVPIVNVDADADTQEGLNLSECRRVEYHRSLILSVDDISHLISPLRLGYVSLRMDNRYLAEKKGLYEEYMRVGFESATDDSSWLHDFYPELGKTTTTDIPYMIYDGSIYFNTKAKRAIPSGLPINEDHLSTIGSGGGATEFVESFVDTLSRTELVGRFQNSPTIHALIQQWFLRHGDKAVTPRLAVTISRAYPAYSLDQGEKNSASRVGEAGVNINVAEFSSQTESDTVVKLESFSVLSYTGLNVSPACSDRSNCASCVATGSCAWCNMAEANVRRDMQNWAGWFANSKARHEDGSACGIPPQICAMMGGEPVSESCSPLWKDEWDFYRD